MHQASESNGQHISLRQGGCITLMSPEIDVAVLSLASTTCFHRLDPRSPWNMFNRGLKTVLTFGFFWPLGLTNHLPSTESPYVA